MGQSVVIRHIARLAVVSSLFLTVTQVHAADVVLDNTSSVTTAAAGDNVTVPDHAGADGNSTNEWIKPDGDDVIVTIEGTLQGGSFLVRPTQDMDNLTIKVGENGAAVAKGTRAFDIDGTSRTLTNVTFVNEGTVYAADSFTVSAQDVQNSSITNKATGSITAGNLAVLIGSTENLVFNNEGTIAVNDDGLSYRGGQTLSRVTSTNGRTIWAEGSEDMDFTNSGTISSITRDTLYFKLTDNVTMTNTGTISAVTSEAIKVEEADNFTLTNSGTISAGTNTIYGDELTDALITNNDNGTLKADDDFVVYLQYADNASLVNHGVIKSDNGSVFDTNNAVSVTITNSGTIKTLSETTDNILTGDNTDFTNSADGIITSTTDGFVLDAGNSFSNYGAFSVGDNKTAISITGNNNNIRFYDNSSYSGTISAGSGLTGNLLTVDNDLAFTLSDNISGAIGLTKTGDGVLEVTGIQGYTGDTTVSAGTLKLNATAASSDVTIASGGTLGGSGTTGDIVNSGTIAPGNSIGTLNVTGDVTLNNSSKLDIEIGKAGSSDKIIATGALTVDGSLKIIPDRTIAYNAVETYEILDGASRTGTFDNITMRACGASLSTAYSSEGVTLTITGCNAKKGDAVKQMETYVTNFYDNDPSAAIANLLTELEGLSGADYEAALSTLDVDAPLAVAASTTQNIQTVNGFMAQRTAAQSGGGASQQLRMMMASDPLSAESKLSVKDRLAKHRRKGMWVKAFGGNGEKKAIKDLGVNGYDYDFQGTTIGFDLESERVKQAIAISVQQGSVTSKNKQGYQDYETVLLNYQNTQRFKDGGRLALSSGLAFTKVDAKRYIAVGAISETAKAKYQTYALDLGAGYTFAPMRFAGLTNDLTLSFAANYNTQESYRETGADGLNLSVAPKHTLTARLGIENTLFLNQVKDQGSSFMPFISTGLYGSRHLTNTAIKQGFVGADKVKVITDRDQELYGEIALGFLHIEEDDDELRFMTKTKFSDKVTEYSASLDYGLKF